MSCPESSKLKNDDGPKTNKKPVSKMFVYMRECIFLCTLIITTYAALFNSLPKVGKPPTPVPFFESTSVVPDYFRGSMSGPFNQVSQSELAVIMFYAPWDASSQRFRPHFDQVARFFRGQVYFAAISCWAPNSECRQSYPKMRSFPVIVAYPQQGNGLQFRGPLNSAHLIAFIRNLMRPLHRVYSTDDIINLLSTHKAVVVGSFAFLGNLGAPGFRTFYSSALKYLERDSFADVAFAVTTNMHDAQLLGVNALPSVTLYLWNETHTFAADAKYNKDAVIDWVTEKVHSLTNWVPIPGYKSTLLKPYLASPTLLIFTPRNPLFSLNPIFSLTQELAFLYSNDDNNNNVMNEWRSRFFNSMQDLNKNMHELFLHEKMKCRKLQTSTLEIVTSSVVTFLPNRSIVHEQCDMPFFGPKRDVCVIDRWSGINFYKNPQRNVSTALKYQTSMWQNEFDNRGPDNLLKQYESDNCRLLHKAYAYQQPVFPQGSSQSENLFLIDKLNGLGLKSGNRSLNFIFLDSLTDFQFAQAFGVDIFNVADQTATLIVDSKFEDQFIMNEKINKLTLTKFILKYGDGKLTRSLRSTLHSSRKKCGESTNSNVCVAELHSETFLPTISKPKAFVILYHTPYCGMCRSISHLFLLLSHYFQFFNGIQFLRIDGENNDLPWEYSMDLYPSILFIPTFDKGESRVFSENLPFSVRNLMHFVLTNLEPEAKVAAVISLCMSFDKYQTDEEAKKCKSRVSREIHDGIARNLNLIRRNMARLKSTPEASALAQELHRRKTAYMHSLQYFRASGLVLMSLQKITRHGQASEIFLIYHRFINNYLPPKR